MKTIELHKNFLLIHKFRYPNEPVKAWVEKDETYTGNYHDDWNELKIHRLPPRSIIL